MAWAAVTTGVGAGLADAAFQLRHFFTNFGKTNPAFAAALAEEAATADMSSTG
jgi:hypothetical protein